MMLPPRYFNLMTVRPGQCTVFQHIQHNNLKLCHTVHDLTPLGQSMFFLHICSVPNMTCLNCNDDFLYSRAKTYWRPPIVAVVPLQKIREVCHFNQQSGITCKIGGWKICFARLYCWFNTDFLATHRWKSGSRRFPCLLYLLFWNCLFLVYHTVFKLIPVKHMLGWWKKVETFKA